MNAPVDVMERRPEADARLGIIDCDIHPYMKPGALNQYLSERWRKHVAEYGKFNCGIYADRGTYPRFSPNTSRRDSWPPGGGLPGSDVAFMREQLLDAYNISYGVLEPLLGGNTSRNLDEAAALCSAMNDWQAHDFVDQEPRLRASILVPQDDPEASVKEIEKRAGDWRFAQIQLGSKTSEPLGRRRYWPIFAAAQANGLSIGLHIGGTQNSAPSASGWPQFYIEDHHMLVHSMQNQAASLILEGVFEAFPKPEDLPDRGWFRLGAVARLAARRALGEDAGRGAAGEAAAIRVHADQSVVRHAAGGGTGEARRSAPGVRVDRLGPNGLLVATIRTGTSTIQIWRSASR